MAALEAAAIVANGQMGLPDLVVPISEPGFVMQWAMSILIAAIFIVTNRNGRQY